MLLKKGLTPFCFCNHLQSYDEYIQKTQAELSGEQGTVPSVKGVQKSSREAVSTRSDSFQR